MRTNRWIQTLSLTFALLVGGMQTATTLAGWQSTASTDGSKEGPLSGGRRSRCRIVDHSDQVDRFHIIGLALDSQRPLPDSRREPLNRQPVGHFAGSTESLESRPGQ